LDARQEKKKTDAQKKGIGRFAQNICLRKMDSNLVKKEKKGEKSLKHGQK